MKKARYITPETILTEVEVMHMICNSITNVGGNTGIEKGDDGDAPATADSRRRNVWEDDEEEEDY